MLHRYYSIGMAFLFVGSLGDLSFSQMPDAGPDAVHAGPDAVHAGPDAVHAGPDAVHGPASALRESATPDRGDSEKEPASAKKTRLDFELTRSVVYRKTKKYELQCDIYCPVGDGPFPAILAVHGGAWRNGTKLAMVRHAWLMAASGYVVVAINYRHAPKYPFPAQIEDCKHAVRWMKSNASTYHIDPERIGAFGYSAGGHLVALLGTSDSNDALEGNVAPEMKSQNSRVHAVAAGAAPCEFDWIAHDSQVLSFWLGGSPDEKPEAYRAASPITYISADDPPFYFFHGDSDLIVPISTTEKMHELLEAAGVPSQHASATGGGHITTFSDLTWMQEAIEFFDSHLGPAQN